uniref:uncharacterized protein isoform X2 n=1 Tax=Semicossyphus pulcher TaxID=241346 RepID=UPI0037E7408B
MLRAQESPNGVSTEQENCDKDHDDLPTHCDAETQWVDPSVFDHDYTSQTQPQRTMSNVGTQCGEPAALYRTLLRNQHLCQLYTGLSLDAFHSLAEDLTRACNNASFQLHPWDQLLMTLIKLRLNLLQGDLAERFGVSQPIVSKVISCWLDLMEAKMRCCIPWLPRETIQATMPQCFREHYPKTTCVIDCSETPIQKPHNLDSGGESYSDNYGENTVKYLISIAPCGLIMFISPAYGGRCSEQLITENSGFLDYLHPGDEVMADAGFGIKDLLYERKVKLVIPFTKESEEDTTNTRCITDVQVHVERVICRLKNFKILSQTLPINLTPKMDKILSICAALCNLSCGNISDEEDE